MAIGAALLVYMMVRWFGDVIAESENGAYSAQVDVSFRMAMMWFIFSEVCFSVPSSVLCFTHGLFQDPGYRV